MIDWISEGRQPGGERSRRTYFNEKVSQIAAGCRTVRPRQVLPESAYVGHPTRRARTDKFLHSLRRRATVTADAAY